MGLGKFLGFDKISRLLEIIKANGGIINSAKIMNRIPNDKENGVLLFLQAKCLIQGTRTDDLKLGTLVGTDQFGNKYYRNDYYFFGTNRWVVYSEKVGLNYDASQIPAEWYGWLHYKTDLLPGEDKSRPKYKWMTEHEENYTGTPKEYVPYSTCRKKIEVWVPPKPCK